jgi:hypothetical protein
MNIDWRSLRAKHGEQYLDLIDGTMKGESKGQASQVAAQGYNL